MTTLTFADTIVGSLNTHPFAEQCMRQVFASLDTRMQGPWEVYALVVDADEACVPSFQAACKDPPSEERMRELVESVRVCLTGNFLRADDDIEKALQTLKDWAVEFFFTCPDASDITISRDAAQTGLYVRNRRAPPGFRAALGIFPDAEAGKNIIADVDDPLLMCRYGGAALMTA
eukprot:3932049-Rhodomonas_salina.1